MTFSEFLDRHSALLIGVGISNDGLTQTMEVFDLNNSNGSSKFFKEFPVKLDSPVSGFLFGETPIVCGNLPTLPNWNINTFYRDGVPMTKILTSKIVVE